MEYVSVRDLKNRASQVVRESARSDVVVTSHGKPVALLQGLNQEELEEYVFYSAAPVRRQIDRRWKIYLRTGRTVRLDQVRRRRSR